MKNLATVQETCRRYRFCPLFKKIPWRREWQPTPVFLPGEFHGPRNLAGYSPRGCKESDRTEHIARAPPRMCGNRKGCAVRSR